MTDDAPPTTLRVLARANLTLEGGVRIDVYDTLEVGNTAEVQACIAQELLVPENPDGTFPDLGPVDRMPMQLHGCCGNSRR